MIQFHVFEAAARFSGRPPGVPAPEPGGLLDSSYRHLTESVLDVIRRETFGLNVGQDSGLTVEAYERFLAWLRLTLEQHVHEVASSAPACVDSRG
jgi:hypothetical protein